MDRNQERIEHQVSISKESATDLEKRLSVLAEYMHNMGQHLNGAIERINNLLQGLKELATDLEYEEFDLEDKNEGFQTEGKIKKQ